MLFCIRPEIRSSLKDLIKKMMTKEPVHRITLPEIKVLINSFTYLQVYFRFSLPWNY